MKQQTNKTFENLEDGSFLKLAYIVLKNIKNKTIQNHIKSNILSNPKSIYTDKDYFEIYFILAAFILLAVMMFYVSFSSGLVFGIFGLIGKFLVSTLIAFITLVPAVFLACFMIVKKDEKITNNG